MPSATISAVASLTEQNIAHWNALFARCPRWSKYAPEDLVGLIARAFPDSRQRRDLGALEVRCGPGPNLWFLAHEGFRVAGIDGFAIAIESAHERPRSEGLASSYQETDLKIGDLIIKSTVSAW